MRFWWIGVDVERMGINVMTKGSFKRVGGAKKEEDFGRLVLAVRVKEII